MLPGLRQTVKHLRDRLTRARPLVPAVAWGLGLWLAVVAVPFAFLFPAEGLGRTVCLLLALLPPLAMAAAALTGDAVVVLYGGLLSLLPILVACPVLQGPRTTGPLQGLLVALISLGFVAQAHLWTGRKRTWSWQPLRRRIRDPIDQLAIPLGLLWLGQAWLVPQVGVEAMESARSLRVASVAAVWLALRLVPLQGRPPSLQGTPGERWLPWLIRRCTWLLLLAGLLWLWRRPP